MIVLLGDGLRALLYDPNERSLFFEVEDEQENFYMLFFNSTPWRSLPGGFCAYRYIGQG